MRTNEERESMIRIRTREIKHNQRVKRRRILDVLVTVACITLVVSIGVLLPKLIYGVTEEHIIHASGAASLIGNHEALGYILIGILGFFLGMCVTTLMFRVRLWDERKDKEDRDDN